MKKTNKETSKKSPVKKNAVVGIRCIHLDLKGTPPTPQRLLSLLDLIKAAHYNAVLAEWEDTFPWSVDPLFRSETAYTPEEICQFAAKAKKLGIEIIPLVQCLGHMETPLKFSKYASLREVAELNDTINPLAPGAYDLVQSMVRDVLTLLPDTKHFHLGGDEAWSFCTHPDTKAFVESCGKGALYMKHVEPLLDMLIEKKIRPILWHDMMIDWDHASLTNLKHKADLCVWGYTESPMKTTSHYNVKYIEKFHKIGITMWGGTAYKGADELDTEGSKIEQRIENAYAWIKTAKRYSMKGIIATGWSRFSTTITQTEPIDSALDSLVSVGIMLYSGRSSRNLATASKLILKKTGEYDRFMACHALMAEIAQKKYEIWNNIRYARENIACRKLDQARQNTNLVKRAWLASIKNGCSHLEKKAAQMRVVFNGLMPEIWIDRYMGDRIEAIKQEIKGIEELLSLLL